ncbi:MAG: methyltransferase [Gemmatimonadetes bacterium]|nr:methyltransferase [Gemmatimonadota bacterium]MBT6144852.1 methyltransferase [Gemmatimonadota bacterium]MBT7862283.1 methyltransferase [Gemmatimonadota bacterium]
MSQTSREIVKRTLRFEHPERMPREMWTLPIGEAAAPEILKEIRRRFPSDFGGVPPVYRPSARVQGNPYEAGSFTDDWGCQFINIQDGVIGEIRDPLLSDLADADRVQPPYETLPEDVSAARDTVNQACAESDLFIRGACCPRPWERYQFLRGTMSAMMDVMDPESGTRSLIRQIHEFYLRELEFWVSTDVDAINFMDDWGAQNQLLIPPAIWRDLFRPLYQDYCDLAHAHGKAVFMHSDGHISEIYPDLVEVGVDALNSQLFCMDMADLATKAKGRMTFWGEIDRQHVLTDADPEVGRQAVRKVAEHLYDTAGGIIAQFEFGAAAQGQTALAIFEEWECVDTEARSAAGVTD